MKKFFYLLLLAMCVNFGLVSCRSTKSVSTAKVTGERLIEEYCPCDEKKGVICGRGVRESMDRQIARNMARSSALQELAGKIQIAVNAVTEDYANDRSRNLNEDLEKKYQEKTETVIKQVVQGYRTACDKLTVKDNNGSQVYTCYYAVELDSENATRAIHKGLTEDEKLRIDYDYEKFKEEFEKALQRAE